MKTYCLHVQVVPEQKFRFVTVGKNRWFPLFTFQSLVTVPKRLQKTNVLLCMQLAMKHNFSIQENSLAAKRALATARRRTYSGKIYCHCNTPFCVGLMEVTPAWNRMPKDAVLSFAPCLEETYFYCRSAPYSQLSREYAKTVLSLLAFFILHL